VCLNLALNDNVLPDGRFKLQLDDGYSFAADESCIAWESCEPALKKISVGFYKFLFYYFLKNVSLRS